jgi:hypothetical protein
MIESLVRLIAVPTIAHSMRVSASEAARRSALGAAAALAGAAGVFCFTRSSLVLMERHIDPAEAWAVIGLVYGALGTVFYFAATKRRRSR